MKNLKEKAVRLLRWSERYTRTDMLYLAGVGLWTNLNFGISTILAFLLSVAFANLLPRDVYGVYQYLISISALISAVCLGGMNNAVAPSVARGFEGDLRESVRVQLYWNIVPTLIGLGVAIYYALHANTEIAVGMLVVAVLSPIVSAFNTYAAFLSGKREFRTLFVYTTIINVAYYISIFAALAFVPNATFLVFVNLGINAAATTYIYFRTLKKYKPNGKVDPQTVPYGAHLSVMNAFGTVISQLDSVLVFHFLGPVSLAVYSFATLIPERLGGLFGFIGTAALPKFATRTVGELSDSILGKTIRAAVAGALGALAYALAAPWLFRIFFPKYLDAVFYTQVYSVIVVFLAANLVGSALQAKGLKRELYITSFINPILLIVLQIPLLLAYGIMGMLVARIISDALAAVLGLFLLFNASRRDRERV